ncbi:MAG: DUF3592 domain-containing protein [Micrococcales bacterium]|nr:DUF3592 domain-containing protein [Micrococcales bacterium]MCL2667068.1 DUF3592 domain-containing protein [Micrococcales bacterium]
MGWRFKFIGVLLVCAAILTVLAYDGLRHELETKDWVATTATVTKAQTVTERHRGRRGVYVSTHTNATLEFAADGDIQQWRGRLDGSVPVGHTLDIRYDPSDPSTVFIPDPGQERFYVYGAAACWAVLLIFVTVLFLRWLFSRRVSAPMPPSFEPVGDLAWQRPPSSSSPAVTPGAWPQSPAGTAGQLPPSPADALWLSSPTPLTQTPSFASTQVPSSSPAHTPAWHSPPGPAPSAPHGWQVAPAPSAQLPAPSAPGIWQAAPTPGAATPAVYPPTPAAHPAGPSIVPPAPSAPGPYPPATPPQ